MPTDPELTQRGCGRQRTGPGTALDAQARELGRDEPARRLLGDRVEPGAGDDATVLGGAGDQDRADAAHQRAARVDQAAQPAVGDVKVAQRAHRPRQPPRTRALLDGAPSEPLGRERLGQLRGKDVDHRPRFGIASVAPQR